MKIRILFLVILLIFEYKLTAADDLETNNPSQNSIDVNSGNDIVSGQEDLVPANYFRNLLPDLTQDSYIQEDNLITNGLPMDSAKVDLKISPAGQQETATAQDRSGTSDNAAITCSIDADCAPGFTCAKAEGSTYGICQRYY